MSPGLVKALFHCHPGERLHKEVLDTQRPRPATYRAMETWNRRRDLARPQAIQ